MIFQDSEKTSIDLPTPADLSNPEGDIDAAIAACCATLLNSPDDPETLFRYAYLLFLENRTLESLQSLDRLLQSAPFFPNASWLRGGVLRRLKGDRDTEVLSVFIELACRYPHSAFIQCELGDIYRANGRYEEARTIFERLQDSLTNDDEECRTEAALKLGIVCEVLGDTCAARNALKTIPESAIEYQDALAMLELL